MAIYKFTMLFDVASNISNASIGHRTGGWSESVYSTFPPQFATGGQTQDLCVKRAALLPRGAAIVGRRIQQVDVVGAANVDGRIFPGGSQPTDIPQMSLLLRFPAQGTQNTRPYLLRCIPDDLVKEGEYLPDSTYPGLLNAFGISLSGWNFKAVDLLTGLTEIETIDNLGNVVLAVPNLFVVNQLVTVLRSTDDVGRRHGGRFRIATVTDSSSFKLSGWPRIATTGGLVRPYSLLYPQIALSSTVTPVRVTTRKVGRSFNQYRGKASTRR